MGWGSRLARGGVLLYLAYIPSRPPSILARVFSQPWFCNWPYKVFAYLTVLLLTFVVVVSRVSLGRF